MKFVGTGCDSRIYRTSVNISYLPIHQFLDVVVEECGSAFGEVVGNGAAEVLEHTAVRLAVEVGEDALSHVQRLSAQ